MQKIMLSGKINFARLTACELDYEGSLEIDPELLAEAGILPYEKILVVNRTNASRLETYAIPGVPGERTFCLNGPAAHLGNIGGHGFLGHVGGRGAPGGSGRDRAE